MKRSITVVGRAVRKIADPTLVRIIADGKSLKAI